MPASSSTALESRGRVPTLQEEAPLDAVDLDQVAVADAGGNADAERAQRVVEPVPPQSRHDGAAARPVPPQAPQTPN